MTHRMLFLLSGVLAALALGVPVRADEIDDAANRPFAEARPALERLLAKAEAAGRVEDRRRILRLLAQGSLRAGDAQGALAPLESLVALAPGDVEARILYAETLLGIAKANIAGTSVGRSVTPFLRDAADALEGLELGKDASLAGGLRARAVRALAEARFLLREFAEALATLDAAEIGSLPADARAGCLDLEARIHYAREAYERAAARFDEAGNPLAAAAAWDAARRPDMSVPIYARLLQRDPGNAGLIARALGAVRFHKAHAALLGLVEADRADAGPAWQRMVAELLEGTGQIERAIGTLEAIVADDPEDADAWVEIGRLRGVQAMSGDAIDEDALDASAAAYLTAIGIAPDHEGAAGGLGWIAAQDYGRLWKSWRNERITGRCLRVQRALAAAVPDDAWAWGNLGNTLRVLGRSEDALAAYARAVEANPYDPAVRSDLGLALAAAGRFDEALEAYEESVALDAGHLAGRQNAARAHHLAGRDEAAAAHLGRAAVTARAVGRSPGTYRFLLDRSWRAGRRSGLR